MSPVLMSSMPPVNSNSSVSLFTSQFALFLGEQMFVEMWKSNIFVENIPVYTICMKFAYKQINCK